jgi:hypothetical protein
MNKPTLKIVKTEGGYERPVIRIETVIPYTEDNWAFVGANAGVALAINAEQSQRDMFDRETGEITAARR